MCPPGSGRRRQVQATQTPQVQADVVMMAASVGVDEIHAETRPLVAREARQPDRSGRLSHPPFRAGAASAQRNRDLAVSSRGSSPAARASPSWVGGRAAGNRHSSARPPARSTAACQSRHHGSERRGDGLDDEDARTLRVSVEERGQQDPTPVGRELVGGVGREDLPCLVELPAACASADSPGSAMLACSTRPCS